MGEWVGAGHTEERRGASVLRGKERRRRREEWTDFKEVGDAGLGEVDVGVGGVFGLVGRINEVDSDGE